MFTMRPPPCAIMIFGACPAQKKNRLDIGVEDFVEAVFAQVHERSKEAARSIVDQYVDPPVRVARSIDKLLNLGALRQVCGFCQRLSARSSYFLCR